MTGDWATIQESDALKKGFINAYAMSEYNERRIKVGEIKANQIKATKANVVITPCHNCVDQLSQINHTYKLNVEIKSVAEIVADALVL